MGNQPASNKATKQAVQRQIVRSQEQNPANKTNALYIVQPPQNAQGQQPGENQQPKSIMEVTEDMIRSCFKSSCINGSLNKEKFNESLSICEEIGLKRLKDTPLGLRLFNIFDLAKDGTVNEEEFVVGLRGLMKEKQKREEFTFKAYDTDQDGQINKEELLYIMSQS